MKISKPVAIPMAVLGAAAPALADPGHVADIAGHSHWIGLAAAGAAAVIGIFALGKKRAAGKAAEAADPSEADGSTDDTPVKA